MTIPFYRQCVGVLIFGAALIAMPACATASGGCKKPKEAYQKSVSSVAYEIRIRQCEGPATIEIWPFGARRASQVITLPSIWQRSDSTPLVFADYNADGIADLALQTGLKEYVYYIGTHGHRFQRNAPLTALAADAYEMPEASNGEVTILRADGSQATTLTRYKFDQNAIVPLQRTRTDAAAKPGRLTTSEEAWRDGSWHTLEVSDRRNTDYCEGVLLAAAHRTGRLGGPYMTKVCADYPGDPSMALIAFQSSVGLDVLLVRLDDGALLANYLTHDLPAGKGQRVTVEEESFELTNGTPTITLQIEHEQADGWRHGRQTMLVREGARLVPVMDGLAVFSTDGTTSVKRWVRAPDETSASRPPALRVKELVNPGEGLDFIEREYSLPYDGVRYSIPADLRLKR